MRFDLGWRDRLFGEKIELELPLPDGTVVKRRVSKRWFDDMQAQGKIAECKEQIVRAHILDSLKGYYVANWIVGQDIAEATVEKFLDPDTNAIYVVSCYRDGKPEVNVAKKQVWEQLREAFDVVDRTS